MTKKVMRTIYLTPELDARVTEMMGVQGHKRSLLVEHMLTKYLNSMDTRDHQAAMESDLTLPQN